MSSFDRNWRELQLETLVDLSLTIGRVRPEEELADELLQRAVGTLDAGSGLVATLHPGGQEAIVRALGMAPSFEAVRAFFPDDLLEELAAGRYVRAQREVGDAPFELLVAPLRAGREVLGAVVLGDKETRVGRIPFSDSDARFLLALASMVGTAVASSRQVAAIERDRQRLADENRELRDVARREGFIGEAPVVREMLETVRRVAPTGVNVMLRGESGVGKERVARLLHSFSDRSSKPFVPLNCAALPESLLEAELFGIEAGVATGVQRRLGKIELANGGTLFLDEVGDLTPGLQAKLLRLVQEREFERLGGRERIPVDLHLVTATNRDLEAMIDSGGFRRDLYYRLRVVVIAVAPLRERRTDIPLLARHFLEVYGDRFGRPGVKLSRDALAALMAFDFPGNVRELENLVQAAIALAPGDVITEEDLRLHTGRVAAAPSDATVSLAELERQHIERVLRSVGGNRAAAARVLGIDRSTLYRKMMRDAPSDATRNTAHEPT
ncbi:MAG: sigma-54-dependent Fis family transcriptional regulator [Thermoanaerobaculales bacterium]|jgi:transcriptional regulator with GAF, ATPase, and Fis domain|nr:sigma-54-dependent Fis family transcriptional regulator [Thermoanaerobaculales bacterium]